MIGEILDVSTSPLTRTSNADLYAVQVYSAVNKENSAYNCYAYAYFDDPANMNIKLLSGYRYKFVVAMMVKGKEVVTGLPIHNLDYGIIQPEGFSKYNSYIFSNKIELMLQDGWTSIQGGSYRRPDIDRYYGEIEGYIPSENGHVQIDMKRVSFGTRFITEGLQDGKLEIQLEQAPMISVDFPESEKTTIFSLYNSRIAWESNESYSEQILLNLSWRKDDGAEIPLGNHTIEFMRNKLTTIRIKIHDNSMDNDFGFNIEDEDMGDGGQVDIETSDNSNNTVQPDSK